MRKEGITSSTGKTSRRRWTDQDDRYLLKHAEDELTQLAEHLQRSPKAVRERLLLLKNNNALRHL